MVKTMIKVEERNLQLPNNQRKNLRGNIMQSRDFEHYLLISAAI
jgi:hypothetical protein